MKRDLAVIIKIGTVKYNLAHKIFIVRIPEMADPLSLE